MSYVPGRGILGYALALAGERAEASRVVRRPIDKSRNEYVAPYDIALVYTGLGERDHALYWLGKAFEVRDHEALHLSVDPLLDPLRGDPRFNTIALRRP